jgi:hypothetical protein
VIGQPQGSDKTRQFNDTGTNTDDGCYEEEKGYYVHDRLSLQGFPFILIFELESFPGKETRFRRFLYQDYHSRFIITIAVSTAHIR